MREFVVADRKASGAGGGGGEVGDEGETDRVSGTWRLVLRSHENVGVLREMDGN